MLSEGVTNEMVKAGVDLHTYTTVSEVHCLTPVWPGFSESQQRTKTGTTASE